MTDRNCPMPRTLLVGKFALCVALSLACVGLSSAQAKSPEITSFTATPSSTQAGGHPDFEIRTKLNNRAFENSELHTHPHTCNCQDARETVLHFPTGVIGDPAAVPTCTLAELSTVSCPIDSQIGLANPAINGESFGFTPLYNVIPHADEAGLIGFVVPQPIGSASFISLHPRTGSDYGLDATNAGIVHVFPFTALDLYIWGVPADPSHDALRRPFHPINNCLQETFENPCYPPVHSNAALRPYLENPTSCGVPLQVSTDILGYDGSLSSVENSWPGTTGCDQLSFNPSLSAVPTIHQTDSVSGLEVDLSVPQQQSPTVPSPSEIKAVSVTLPPDFTINSNAADGKTACSNESGAFGTEGPALCPEFAKVGTLSIDSSALPGPLPGYIYIGQPEEGDRYRLFLVADGFGVHVKLAGSILPNPSTGQISVSFTDLPQTPFQDFNMHFFGSDRGFLVTPRRCGTYPVKSEFTPWDSALPPQQATQFFSLDAGPGGGPCPGQVRPFSPSFHAGSADNTAGAYSPFSFVVKRQDGEQNLVGIHLETPPGFTANLTGIPYCPEAAIERYAQASYLGATELGGSACPAASQIGTATAGAGAGTHPLYLGGKVYLAGPYKGAPLSLVAVFPAVSGPYDLGNVAVRTALKIDPTTAQVTATSDPIPTILGGIPLRTRYIEVSLDRNRFTLNPTNCDPFKVTGLVAGDEGTSAAIATGFQVANCSDLSFGPRISITLTGGVHRLGHPAIHAVLSTRPGEANLSAVSVTLPPSELLDNDHFGSVCPKADFAQHSCPPESLLGHAEVTTPVLGQPLSGNVYLRTSGRGLPDLALDLTGQVPFQASASIDAVNGGLRTTFHSVPDVPLGTIRLDLLGGAKGLIRNSEDLCGAHKKIETTLRGQNNKHLHRAVALRVGCGKGHRPSKPHRASKSRRARR